MVFSTRFSLIVNIFFYLRIYGCFPVFTVQWYLQMHLRSVIAEGGRETNLTDNCKSIREGGFTGCNSSPRTRAAQGRRRITYIYIDTLNIKKHCSKLIIKLQINFNN